MKLATKPKAIVLFLFIIPAALFSPEARSEALKIAVVNPETILNQLKEKEDLDAKLLVERQDAEEDLKSLKEEIEKLQYDVALLASGSEDQKNKEEELAKKKKEFVAIGKVRQKSLGESNFKYTLMMYKRIMDKVSEYAKKNDYNFVFRSSKDDFASISGPTELSYRVFERTVIYADKSTDISQTIADLLNEDYINKKKAATQ